MDGTSPCGCGHALNFERALCHLVRAPRDRPGDVVADVLTSLREVRDHFGDAGAGLTRLL